MQLKSTVSLIKYLFTGHVEELGLQADISTEAGTEEPLVHHEVTSVDSPIIDIQYLWMLMQTPSSLVCSVQLL